MAFGFYFVAALCNNPHYMATVYRAYGTRQDFSKYRFFTIHLTVLLIISAVLLHWHPAWVPYVFTIYIIWSPWHYTGQNFGLALMMARRNGAQPSTSTRNLIHFAFLVSYLLWAVEINTVDSDDPHILSLNLAQSLAHPLEAVLIATTLITGGVGMWTLAKFGGIKKMVAPLTLFITQFLWFVFPIVLRSFTSIKLSPLFYTTGMLAFMHCSQYLWVTSYFAKREAAGKNWNFWKYYFVLIVGGIALFIPGPWIISRVFHQDLVESLLIFIALVNIHHFILDGAIWKLRDGKIARLLLGNNPPAEEDAGDFPEKIPRSLKIGLIIVILIIGVADQTQYYLTMDKTTWSRLETAARLNPNDTRVYFQRAKILEQSGDTTAALQELDQAIALNPHNLPPQSSKGRILARLGQKDAAFEQFDKITALFKPMPQFLINAASFAVQTGHADQAVPKYELALKRDPGNPDLHLAFAEALQMSGHDREAINHYSFYVAAINKDLSPEQVPVKLVQAEIKMADSYLTLHLMDKAAFWYNAASLQAHGISRFDLESAGFQRTGEILEKDEKNPEANTAYQNAIHTAYFSHDQHRQAEAWLAYGQFVQRHGPNRQEALAACLLAEKYFTATSPKVGERPEETRGLVDELTKTLGPEARDVHDKLADYERKYSEGR